MSKENATTPIRPLTSQGEIDALENLYDIVGNSILDEMGKCSSRGKLIGLSEAHKILTKYIEDVKEISI